jgi:hypothetical protein
MRSLWIIVLCVILATAQTLAQQTTEDEAEQLRRANRKITIGLALMGAGALAAPLTALARRQGDTGGPAMNVSIGMIFVGGGVAWWGATERRRAVRPQIAIGVDVGRTVGFHFRRIW